MSAPAQVRLRPIVGRTLLPSVVLYAIVLTGTALLLPSRVPLHWNGAGRIDRFGTPLDFAITFAIPGLVVLIVFLGITVLLRRASLALINVPYPQYWKTASHEARLRTMVAQDLRFIFTAVYLLLTVIVISVGASVRVSGGQLSWVVPLAVGLFLLFVFGYIAYIVLRRYRPPLVTDPEDVGAA